MGSGNIVGVAPEYVGIIPRFINDLFAAINQRKGDGIDFLVRASFVELYNEDFNDLLDPGFKDKSSAIQIRDDPNGGGVVLLGVKEEEVKAPSEMLKLLEKGSLCRSTGSTNMNATSSRSHAVFTVIVEQAMADGEFTAAKFRFVDLAGWPTLYPPDPTLTVSP